ncbi:MULTISPECIES: hypothetical protein [unclassified Roseitalea]|uniref:hypothetical protein n=1 Tax=unclassified Roseitalea TaxID=2639107 RepID=UPI00273E1402|nr:MULTISPECIES: hypothetical protein [unclassified Roseitalea]
MKAIVSSLVTALAALALGGCVAGDAMSVAPSPLAPTRPAPEMAGILAPLQGGLVGRMAELGMDDAARLQALQTEYRALEYTAPGDIASWQGQGGRVAGQVVPSQPYRVGSQDCRQFTHTITAGTEEVVERGTACRNADGSWALLS